MLHTFLEFKIVIYIISLKTRIINVFIYVYIIKYYVPEHRTGTVIMYVIFDYYFYFI